MKTTLDISDNLLQRAKRLAEREQVTLRSLAEEGLARVLEEREHHKRAKVKPVTFKGNGLQRDFQTASWDALRDAAYEGHGG